MSDKMGGIGGLFDLMKNAKQMMEKAKSAQERLAKQTVEGSAGAGLVTARLNGNGELIGLKLEKAVVNPDDIEMLTDLVISAVADARKRVVDIRSQMFEQVAGGADLSSLGIDKSMLF